MCCKVTEHESTIRIRDNQIIRLEDAREELERRLAAQSETIVELRQGITTLQTVNKELLTNPAGSPVSATGAQCGADTYYTRRLGSSFSAKSAKQLGRNSGTAADATGSGDRAAAATNPDPSDIIQDELAECIVELQQLFDVAEDRYVAQHPA